MVTVEYKKNNHLLLIFLQPNRSLSWRQNLFFYLGIAGFALLVALVFAVLGYWLVLPFAGFEIIALGVCMYLVAQEGRKRQVISITHETVCVEKGLVRRSESGSGGPQQRVDLVRAWTQVNLQGSRQAWHPSRLTLAASGQEVEVGEFLTEEERKALAEELGAAISRREAC